MDHIFPPVITRISDIERLLRFALSIFELLVEVPLGLLRNLLFLLSLPELWRFINKCSMLVGALLWLPGGLSDLPPDLLVRRHVNIPILVPE